MPLTTTMLSVQASPIINEIRTAEMAGQEYTVIPCVALVEGVLWPANAPYPELALAEEFGRFPEGWNGRPVTLSHPVDKDGVPVAANSPEVLENTAFGQIFNTRVEDNKLKTEIWVNNARVEELGEDFKSALERLQDSENPAEISTGLFSMQEIVNGEFNGEQYDAVWRNIVPDHLAVLPEGVRGACSVEDGCGAPRANQMQPVMNAAHLRDLSKDESCGCQTGGTQNQNQNGGEEKQGGVFKRLMDSFGHLMQFKSNSETLSDSDVRTGLYAALESQEDRFIWIVAVFHGSDGTGQVIYEKGFDDGLISRGFTMDNAGAVTLQNDEVPVRPVTEFVPLDVNANNLSTSQANEVKPMTIKVDDLITNEKTRFEESDRKWLEGLEEEQLQKLAPEEEEPTSEGGDGGEGGETTTTESGAGENGGGTGGESVEQPPVAAASTPEEYIAQAPDEVQAVLNQSLRMHRARKQELIKGLTANERCKFSEEQLKTKDIDELENLAVLANIPSYEGQSVTGGQDVRHNAGDDSFVPAPSLFTNEQDTKAH